MWKSLEIVLIALEFVPVNDSIDYGDIDSG